MSDNSISGNAHETLQSDLHETRHLETILSGKSKVKRRDGA